MKGRDTTTQAALEEKEGSDLLNRLPTDLLQLSGDFIPVEKRTKTLASLARANNRFHTLFKPAADAEVVKTLSNAIVHGDPNKVYPILDKHPFLLLDTFTVTDPAGYILKDRTPLQAALCCQDPEMTEEILKRLIKHAGPKKAVRQWDAQFPIDWKKTEAARWNPVFRQLDKLNDIIQAAEEKDISVDEDFKLEVSEGSTVERELEEFQRLLRATRDEPIETGRAFNPLLLQALASCYDHYCSVLGYNHPKSLLFWQRIFGYAQRFLSASDAQAFVAGVHPTANNLNSKKPQRRNLEIEIYDSVSREWTGRDNYYSGAGLGVDYGIYVYGHRRLQYVGARLIERFLSDKNRHFSETYAATPRSKIGALYKARCSVM